MLGLGGMLLLLTLGTLLANIEQARESSRSVAHTQAVLAAVDKLSSAADRLEAAQRGLLAARSPRFERERAGAIEALSQGLPALVQLTLDNPRQQARLRELQQLVAQRLEQVRRNEDLTRRSPEQARALIESPEVLGTAAAIRMAVDALGREQRDLLDRRLEAQSTFQARSLRILGLALAASLLMAALAMRAWSRQSLLYVRSESRFRALVQALPVSVWQLRMHPARGWQFDFISDNARELRGIDTAAVLRKREGVLANVAPQDRPGLEAALARSAESLEPLDVQYRIEAPDGGWRWIHSGAHARRDRDGSVLLSGYWADITRERELNQALEEASGLAQQANTAKSAFLAAMSHEIRTPMNGVLGLLELLGLSRLEDEQRATLTVVRESAGALLRIVDDILDFSKIEAGKMDLHPAPASLAEVVRNVCQVHGGMASGKGLLLAGRVDPRIAARHVFDAQRVGQILHNLVSNALKFTREGSVTVEAQLLAHEAGRERIELRVTDTGVGIAPADMARIFKPFVQVGAETSGRLGGTGLGLVICQHLAGLMGGQLQMQSVPGRGTEVRLVLQLPLAEGAAMPSAPEPAPPPELQRRLPPPVAQAEVEGTLVLVVDDHPTNRMVLKRQVNSLGYAARSVADGRQALEAWRSGHYRLVIADCNMPEMSGYELARAIRAEEAAQGLARTPILACTANALVAQSAEWQEAGMDGYLVKPAPLQELGRQLARWLPLPDAAQDGQAIDHELLDAISSGSAQVRAEILADFRRANETDADLLRAAVASSDLARVIQFAHRIKGACMVVGALPLAEACRHVDQAARAGPPALLPAAMEAFEREFTRLAGGLDDLGVAAGQVA